MIRRKVDKAWFQGQLRHIDSSQRKLAGYLGLDFSAITRMLDGERKVEILEAYSVAKFLGQPFDEVLRRFGLPDQAVTGGGGVLNVAGDVDQFGWVTFDDDRKVDLVPAPPGLASNARVLRAETAATRMDLLNGWLLFYAPKSGFAPSDVGRLCVVELDSGECLVRFLYRVTRQGRCILVEAATGKAKEEDVASASPVLWIQP